MKPELLREFFKQFGGTEKCIAMLKSKEAWMVALKFVRLVRSTHSQKERKTAELDLGESLEYQVLLLKALETGAYEEVEAYTTKAIGLQPRPEVSSEPVPVDDDDASLATAFESEYVRGAENTLYEYLERCNKAFKASPQSHYAKFCSIVQSSGTGKSRTLIELKQKGVVVLYMNIRGIKEVNAYPSRDTIPADILTTKLECSEEDYTCRTVAFFTALFRTLKDRLETYAKVHSSREDVIKAWSSDMCKMGNRTRAEFFEELQRQHEKILQRIQPKPQKTLEASMGALSIKEGDSTSKESPAPKLESPSTSHQDTREPSTAGPSGKDKTTTNAGAPGSGADRASDEQPSDGKQKKPPPGPQLPGEVALTKAYRNLISMTSVFDSWRNGPQLVIAIDEAHLLRQLQETYLPSHILCRTISVFSKSQSAVSNWVIFASTASKVADFSAPAHIHASLRIHHGGPLLFPPYSLLDWDQRAPALSRIDLENVAQFGHIAKLGRPLWQSLIESGVAPQLILSTAHSKLCHSQSFDKNNPNHMLAVLGQRFILDICFGSYQSSEFQQTAVSSHLRVCLGWTEDRTWQETAYPSEPLLSCAAAQIMYQQPPNPWGARVVEFAFRHLQEAVIGRLMNPGQPGQPGQPDQAGELVCRLLYLMGKDLAIRRHDEPAIQDTSSELLDCMPLPVTEYLDVMFGLDKLDSATDIFKDWYVNFSHWVPMSENIKFEGQKGEEASCMQAWLARHWARTSAVQCYHHQPSFDQVIPMYKLRKPSEPKPAEDEYAGRVSFILVSDKARARAASETEVDTVSPEKAKLPNLGQPHIAILADVRATNAGVESWSCDVDGATALRILVSGIGQGAYRFLGEPGMSSVGGALRRIVDLPDLADVSTPNERKVSGRSRFGSTTRDENMVWR